MKYFFFIILSFLIILSGCSSIPNVNSASEPDSETNWNKVLGSLIPNDPVPSEIKLKKGNYIVADIKHVRDGDSLTITNVDTSNIEDSTTANKILSITQNNSNSLGVRFISIDTPEITNDKNEYYGKEAKEAVEDLLLSKKVILELDDKALFDNYDRLIAHAFTTEGASVQEYLLSNGLARVAYLYDDYKYTKDYQHAEEQAKIKKLNIHSIKGYVKWDETAGFDMSVPTGSEWIYDSDVIPVEDVLEGMDKIKWSDLFNIGVSGAE